MVNTLYLHNENPMKPATPTTFTFPSLLSSGYGLPIPFLYFQLLVSTALMSTAVAAPGQISDRKAYAELDQILEVILNEKHMLS